MSSTRRELILRAGAVGLAIAVDGVSTVVRAQAEPFRFKIGEAEVIVLSDGAMTLPSSLVLPGRPATEIEDAYKSAGWLVERARRTHGDHSVGRLRDGSRHHNQVVH